MITCPWCGTNYTAFQPNCKNCGGPLPPPQPAASPSGVEVMLDDPPMPPAAPRPISDSYAWRLLASDGWAITSLVFLMTGGIFACVGFSLIVGIVTAIVGIPFGLLGLAMFGGALAMAYWRYQEAMKVVRVLRDGQATTGQIISADANYSVQVNGRHPWTIRYQFRVNGRDYEGRVSTLNEPGNRLQPGRRAVVLYLPTDPAHNALYPHP